MKQQLSSFVSVASIMFTLLPTAIATAQQTAPAPTPEEPTLNPSAVPDSTTQPNAAPATTAPIPAAPPATPVPPAPQPPTLTIQQSPVQADAAPQASTHLNRHRLQLSYFGGWAVHDYLVATVAYSDNYGTSGTTDIHATFGGGMGGLFTYGFALFEFLELTASLGVQHSGINLGDAEFASNPPSGGFLRSVVLLAPQVNVPLHRFSDAQSDGAVRLTLTGGPSMNGGPTLDSDMSAIPGGTHTALTYKPAWGWHGAAGIEVVAGKSDAPKAGFGLRLGYYAVTYTLQSATENGATMPISNIARQFQNVSGDAVNVSLYMAVIL